METPPQADLALVQAEGVISARVKAGSFAGGGERARLRLFQLDKHCYWCGRETVLYIPYSVEQMRKVPSPPLNATVDHVPNGGEWLVNSCAECNSLRNSLEKKKAVHKRISKTLVARWGQLLELWLVVGRAETKPLAEYALTRGTQDP